MSMPFLPLYFDDEDEMVWEYLKTIEPERRSAFVKEILRGAIGETTEGPLTIGERKCASLEQVSAKDQYIEEFSVKESFLEGLSLESLYISPGKGNDSNQAGNSSAISSSESNPSSFQSPEPWDYLLQQVIGIEDDEAVIAAVQGIVAGQVPPDPDKAMDKESLKGTEYGEDSVQATATGTLVQAMDGFQGKKGLEYLLSQVIGEEQDEEVIGFLNTIQKV
ncbi:MAG: hypothetical protein ACYCVD_16540 [Desulfitobacteriaceae bacterium]